MIVVKYILIISGIYAIAVNSLKKSKKYYIIVKIKRREENIKC